MPLWNAVALRAYRDGAEYFYLVNDDLELSSAGWCAPFPSSVLFLGKNRRGICESQSRQATRGVVVTAPPHQLPPPSPTPCCGR
jgi:hypothetical protein|eukprot:SAG25_NODE_1534_length_2831_cov_3.062592_3_plen_84_part_00